MTVALGGGSSSREIEVLMAAVHPGDGGVLLAEDGAILAGTEKLQEFTGLPDCVGMNFRDLLASPEIPLRERELADVFRDGQLLIRDLEVRRRDGRLLAVDVTATRVEVEHRQLALVVLRDVEARLEHHRAVARAARHFGELFEAIPDAVILVSAQRTIVLANAATDAVFGYPAGTLIGRLVDDLLPPRLRAQHAAHFEEYIRHPMARPMGSGLAVVAQHRDGREFPADIMLAPVSDGEMSVLCVVRDISDVRRREDELREARNRLEQAVQAGDIGLWDWDLRTNSVWLSAELKRQIGYADHEMANTFEAWRSRLHPDDLGPALDQVKATIAGSGTTYRAEFRFRHKDGSYRDILALGTLFRDADGSPSRLVGSHVDVTEYFHLQQRVLQVQKMESIGRLAGGVAHDFNNLLTVILGVTAELVHRTSPPLEPRLRQDLETIQDAGTRAADLTGQLLAFSRQQSVTPTVVDINHVVKGLEPMLRRLIEEHISLQVRPAPDLWRVRADRTQLDQLIVNLVVNARDATASRGGTITLGTANTIVDAPVSGPGGSVPTGRYAAVTVSDDGEGMTPEVRARIFEPYFTTKATSRGTGLGLAMVYGIVKQCGGHITVESEPQRGTTFRVYLPPVDVGAPEGRRPAPPAAPRGTETVLLVEDQEAVRRVAALALARFGYVVLEAAGAAEAMRIAGAESGRIDLLLTDVVMPGTMGDVLAASLRAQYPEMRVLYMSGYTSGSIPDGALTEPGVQLLQKPFTPADLARAVREALDRASGREPSE